MLPTASVATSAALLLPSASVAAVDVTYTTVCFYCCCWCYFSHRLLLFLLFLLLLPSASVTAAGATPVTVCCCCGCSCYLHTHCFYNVVLPSAIVCFSAIAITPATVRFYAVVVASATICFCAAAVMSATVWLYCCLCFCCWSCQKLFLWILLSGAVTTLGQFFFFFGKWLTYHLGYHTHCSLHGFSLSLVSLRTENNELHQMEQKTKTKKIWIL